MVPAGVTQIEVKTAKSNNHNVVIKSYVTPQERPDPTPIEIGIQNERPLTWYTIRKGLIKYWLSFELSGHMPEI